MVQRRVSTFTPNSFHSIADIVVPSGSYPYASQGPIDHRSHLSFDEADGGSTPDDCVHTPASGVADIAFNPWLLEMRPSASPLSRSSSLSGSECISTPPYIDSPMYHVTSQPHPFSENYLIRDSDCINNVEHNWQHHFTEAEICRSQPSHSMWDGGSYGGLPLPSMEYYVQPFVTSVTSSFSQYTPDFPSNIQSTDSAPLNSSDSDSSFTSGSDSESDSSEYEDDSQDKASRLTSGSKTKVSTTVSVMKLGKWSMAIDPFTHPEQRHYICPLFNKLDANDRPCEQRFVRPEHLRRHMKTVHGNDRPHGCKVPRCEKAFSRGDNLRDHYWTHLDRGGRAGKNDKMSLEELKIILGPKEKKLAKKLKLKLINEKRKQRTKA